MGKLKRKEKAKPVPQPGRFVYGHVAKCTEIPRSAMCIGLHGDSDHEDCEGVFDTVTGQFAIALYEHHVEALNDGSKAPKSWYWHDAVGKFTPGSLPDDDDDSEDEDEDD